MKHLERQSGKAIDLLICCGDFQVFHWVPAASRLFLLISRTYSLKLPRPVQAVRNMDDLECLACPPKYRALNTFWKYYTGQATAPYPTLFSKSEGPVHSPHICCRVVQLKLHRLRSWWQSRSNELPVGAVLRRLGCP